jgi:hypothetical protein
MLKYPEDVPNIPPIVIKKNDEEEFYERFGGPLVTFYRPGPPSAKLV